MFTSTKKFGIPYVFTQITQTNPSHPLLGRLPGSKQYPSGNKTILSLCAILSFYLDRIVRLSPAVLIVSPVLKILLSSQNLLSS